MFPNPIVFHWRWVFLVLEFPLFLGPWDSWRAVWLVKTDGEGIEYFIFFSVLCHQVPNLFNSKPAFPLGFLLLHTCLQKFFVLHFTSPVKFSSRWVFVLLPLSLNLDSVTCPRSLYPASSSCTLPFEVFWAFALSGFGISLFIHEGLLP